MLCVCARARVIVGDLGTSTLRRPRPALGCRTIEMRDILSREEYHLICMSSLRSFVLRCCLFAVYTVSRNYEMGKKILEGIPYTWGVQ